MKVIFHFNAADKLGYALRLLRRVHASGARARVVGPDAELDRLHRSLWEQDPNDFVPHLRVRPGAEVADRLLVTPMWLGAAPARAGCGMLVNLGEDIQPSDCAGVDRINEIVSTDESDRAAARQRWRRYEQAGWIIQRHEVTT